LAQAVGRWSLTAETQLRARVNSCEICGGQSDTGTVFSPSASVFPLSVSFHRRSPTRIILGMNNIVISSQVLFHNGSLLH
jgi:hypothetical protein